MQISYALPLCAGEVPRGSSAARKCRGWPERRLPFLARDTGTGPRDSACGWDQRQACGTAGAIPRLPGSKRRFPGRRCAGRIEESSMKSLRLLTFGAALLASASVMAADLRVALQDDPDVLDPHRARTFVGRIVFTSLCDKLVDINANLEIVPQIATEWSWSDDNTVLTMKLREG